MFNEFLPDFQKYLISCDFVTQKNVSYYVHWVSKFLAFSNNSNELPRNLSIKRFLDHLTEQKEVTDWQVKQAKCALQLYFDNFQNNAGITTDTGSLQKEHLSFDLPRTLHKIREALRIKHYAYKTERTYTDWAKRFFDYIINIKQKDLKSKVPDSDDVRDFLSHLAIKKRVSASTQNQAFNAILFLFRNVLQLDLQDLGKTVRAKRGIKLPVVLSIEEVQKLFKYCQGKRLLFLQLLYGSGLRLMELVRLRIKDIDFHDNMIFVRNGKHDNDRSTILPERVKDTLNLHLQEVKLLHEKDIEAGYGKVYLPNALDRKYPNAGKDWLWQYVFPAAKLSIDPRSGKIRRHHIGEKSIQNTVRNAAREAGIAKHVTVHTLRHCFATHLLMNGVNIRQIQDLLGHKHVETTMIYTHVLRDLANAPKSPLDNLYNPDNNS